MNDFEAIQILKDRNKSKREIAKITGLDRKTVRRYIQKINEGDTKTKKNISKPSIINPFLNSIKQKLQDGCTATQIFQDLSQDKNFKASYSTVKRTVAQLKTKNPDVYCRMIFQPAEEAQIDFGQVQNMIVDGKSRKTWLFVITLCYSRMAYYELVLDQTVPTFLNVIRRGLEYFRAVPKSVKPDNLKSAVLIDQLGQRQYQQDFLDFCRHYSTVPNAARPYTPTDKGRVERDIRYAKGNCFKGRNFKSFEQAQDFLKHWMNNVANLRVHRTTNKQPKNFYEDKEIQHMLPLPAQPYECCTIKHYKVRKDCHINIMGNFYSVPYRFVGQNVLAKVSEQRITVIAKDEIITQHYVLKGRCKTSTRKEHYPSEKRIPTHKIHQRRIKKIRQAGMYATQYLSVIKNGPLVLGDQVARLAGLIDEHGSDSVDRACQRALFYQAKNGVSVIKRILQHEYHQLPLPGEAESENLLQQSNINDFGRPLAEYDSLLRLVNSNVDDDQEVA